MKCFSLYSGFTLLILFLSFSLIITAKPKSKKVKKTKPSLETNPNHFAIATLLKSLGSKQTIKNIVKNLNKKCKNLKILERTQTTLKNLRKKHAFLRTALKKSTVPLAVRNNLYQNFFLKLINRLLKCSVISNSKVGKMFQKAGKLLKKGKKIQSPLTAIRSLVKVTNAKAKKQRGFFYSVKKYYRFLKRKKMIKKLLKKQLSNPIKKNKNSIKLANSRLSQISALSKKIKFNLKKCVLFKGKFGQKACEIVKNLRKQVKQISSQVFQSLNKTCKASRTYCIHKGKKKFCRKAHKICTQARKIGLKMTRSSNLINATKFGKILSGLIINYIK